MTNQKTLLPPVEESDNSAISSNTLKITEEGFVTGAVTTIAFEYDDSTAYVNGAVTRIDTSGRSTTGPFYMTIIDVVDVHGTIIAQRIPETTLTDPVRAIESCIESVEDAYDWYNSEYVQ